MYVSNISVLPEKVRSVALFADEAIAVVDRLKVEVGP